MGLQNDEIIIYLELNLIARNLGKYSFPFIFIKYINMSHSLKHPSMLFQLSKLFNR